MGTLDGRVAIVTGAGRGLGRAHARYLAAHGAAVVVNDLGAAIDGGGSDDSPAYRVVREIRSAGGAAIASGHDVADWAQAADLIDLAVETFDGLDVLVNNAGVLRDRALVNLTEEDWDTVIRVHLKGHLAPTRHAMAYWRARSKTGRPVRASVVHTTSVAAFSGNFGQAGYSTAKAGLIGLSRVVSLEGRRYGVRSNAVSPSAFTRMSGGGPDGETRAAADDRIEALDPSEVSPLIAWLAQKDCPADSQVFHCMKGRVVMVSAPRPVHVWETDDAWTVSRLDELLTPSLLPPPDIADFLGFSPDDAPVER